MMAVLQHVEFEGPAAVADWAAGRGFPLRLFHLHRDPTLPSLADFEMLTVMGGPMSANDEARLGWLGPEIALVRDAIAADKTVFGICLGAQIIAKALGARVYSGGAKEIGWFPVQRTLVRILSLMAYLTPLRHFTGMATHSICLAGQCCSPRAKLPRLRRLR